MSEVSQGPGWWQASDLKWYPPERHPNYEAPPPPPPGQPPVPPPRPAERPPTETATPPPWSGYPPRREVKVALIAAIVLIVLGLVLPSLVPTFGFAHVLFIIGLLVLVVGLVLMAVGKTSKPAGANQGEYVQGCRAGLRDHPPAKDPGKYDTP